MKDGELDWLSEVSDQKSQAWHDVRCGRFTSSEIWRLFTDPREKAKKEAGELSEGAKTYVMEKVAEELTGASKDFHNAATDWGEDMEPRAKACYLEKYGVQIDFAVFVPYLQSGGGSPDGYIREKKVVVEIKCPFNSAEHVKHLTYRNEADLKKGKCEYWYQIQKNIFITKSDSGLFLSFDPRMPDDLRLHEIEVQPCKEFQLELIIRLDRAWKVKQEIMKTLKA